MAQNDKCMIEEKYVKEHSSQYEFPLRMVDFPLHQLHLYFMRLSFRRARATKCTRYRNSVSASFLPRRWKIIVRYLSSFVVLSQT